MSRERIEQAAEHIAQSAFDFLERSVGEIEDHPKYNTLLNAMTMARFRIEVEKRGYRKGSDQALQLFEKKDLGLYTGDAIRWTASDHKRGLINADRATVTAIDQVGVTVTSSSGMEHKLKLNDPMLKRIDLAYALNAHMAQGLTADKGIAVLDSRERRLLFELPNPALSELSHIHPFRFAPTFTPTKCGGHCGGRRNKIRTRDSIASPKNRRILRLSGTFWDLLGWYRWRRRRDSNPRYPLPGMAP